MISYNVRLEREGIVGSLFFFYFSLGIFKFFYYIFKNRFIINVKGIKIYKLFKILFDIDYVFDKCFYFYLFLIFI